VAVSQPHFEQERSEPNVELLPALDDPEVEEDDERRSHGRSATRGGRSAFQCTSATRCGRSCECGASWPRC